jgi:hypothetical protein
MDEKDYSLYQDRLYIDRRLRDIGMFFNTPHSKGLKSETIRDLFTHLLSRQEADGSWPDPGGKWTAVQTAVVLKALAALGYTAQSVWPLSGGRRRGRGGVQKALDFFTAQGIDIRPARVPNDAIEDIWDICQVLLAFASYNKKETYEEVAHYIDEHWSSLSDAALANEAFNWRGPGFLAAMVDALVLYVPEGQSVKDLAGKLIRTFMGTTGLVKDWPPEPCWHLALALRTIAQLPDHVATRDDRKAVCDRLASALLSERPRDPEGNYYKYWGKKGLDRHWPMYTARALQGLAVATPYLTGDLLSQALRAMDAGNQYLFSRASQDPDLVYPGIMIGDLKSCTAVAEYFASLITSVPVGVLIDAAECLTVQVQSSDKQLSHIVSGGHTQSVKGGLKIAWLSDLHISDVEGPKGQVSFEVRRIPFFRQLFLPTKNRWTEGFAAQNLELILDQIHKQRFDHVLITGDVTMLGLPEQFKRAREKFIGLQSRMGIANETDRLSPQFWTILPGNHDVTGAWFGGRLAGFWQAFEDTFADQARSFPFRKGIVSPRGTTDLQVEVIGLDSNPRWGVQYVGMNARGVLGKNQMESLREVLALHRPANVLTVVALHHSPIITPFFKPQSVEYFMGLDARDASSLITLCCTHNVKAILHGHYHVFCPWYAPVGMPHEIKGYMPIIGSPCGTTDNPGQAVRFLELREVAVQKGTSIVPGLTLICQSLHDNVWTEVDLGVVIAQ